MTVNYHTHTPLCHHASGDEREYIENAIRSGIRKLGFSDHSPMFFDGDYYSTYRMRPEAAVGYVRKLRRLAEEYRSDIEILVGFEAEYYPQIFSRLLAFSREQGVDYFLLGQHFIGREEDGLWSQGADPAREKLTGYVDQVIAGMETGYFTYLAHPDILNYTGDDKAFYDAEMTRLCLAAKRLGIPLEMNILGYSGRRNYPSVRFFRLAAEVGNEVIVGCDAHDPAVLADTGMMARAEEFLRSLGITPVSDIPLRPIL